MQSVESYEYLLGDLKPTFVYAFLVPTYKPRTKRPNPTNSGRYAQIEHRAQRKGRTKVHCRSELDVANCRLDVCYGSLADVSGTSG
jgi:hypothetical protein